ncbi:MULTISPECIES: molybdopterin-dependent oxidoreductase [Aeromonas]|jgi:anaerobic selenocysteine-containing dehydrogenase|uniref:molybdopterin-dependent oxidoreductase n=1 Tax=Aeromonas TaxID=642 RepID=UPI00067C055E|nr:MULTISPECIES: molybdopterin-dependent oxidoreductase [Aeromonas]OJW67682.1 MAG: dehydrogenase [Aeromonas sp. 62-46]UBQ49471.1 molybdopterin-dependent oxidoreductase [Aeromonas hydrophila]
MVDAMSAHKHEFLISRRGFLLGASALAASSIFTPNAITMAMAKAGMVYRPGEGEWLPSTCNGCTSFCAKQVYMLDGRALHIRGNEHSKVHGKSSCPRQYLALQELYDADRLKTPLLRTNPQKGRGIDPGFKPISWPEAINLIADKLMELRANDETHRYVALRGRYSELSDVLIKNFTAVLGSPNAITHSSLCAEADKFSSFFTEGDWGYRQYDIQDTRYILSFGVDPLSANRQVSYYSSAWGDMLDKAQVAIVDPRYSSSAAKADEWLPVIPGQDGALALALAHVILTEGLWHKPFVGDFTDPEQRFVTGQPVSAELFAERHTHGLVQWWNLELKDRTPEWAAPICGIPVEKIRRLAHKLGDAAPRVQIWRSRGIQMQQRGAYIGLACHALNGLLGAVDSKGGVLQYNKTFLTDFASGKEYADEIAKHGLKKEKIDRVGRLEWPALKKGESGAGVMTNVVADSILEEDPYLPKVLLGYFNNFAFSAPGAGRWEKALAKVPFVAHVSTHVSEFSWFSDLLLPAPHFMFERWGIQSTSGNRHSQVSITTPLVTSLGNDIGDETGLPWLLAEALAKRGYDAPLRYFQEQFKDPETGKSPANHAELGLFATKLMTQPLWDPAQYTNGDRFDGWEHFKKIGVWNSSPYSFESRWSKMKTATHKFEFYSETLKVALETHASKHGKSVNEVMNACHYTAEGELAYVPHYEPPFRFGDVEAYPMLFVDHKSRLNREGRSANTTWYQRNRDLDPGEKKNKDVVKINPLDAKSLGLSEGDLVKLTTVQGSITCEATLFEGVRPGTVAKAFGQGHWAYGRTAALEFGKLPRGGNNNDILPPAHEHLSGSAAYYGAIGVRVEKV